MDRKDGVRLRLLTETTLSKWIWEQCVQSAQLQHKERRMDLMLKATRCWCQMMVSRGIRIRKNMWTRYVRGRHTPKREFTQSSLTKKDSHYY